jgi:hypothetical protein
MCCTHRVRLPVALLPLLGALHVRLVSPPRPRRVPSRLSVAPRRRHSTGGGGGGGGPGGGGGGGQGHLGQRSQRRRGGRAGERDINSTWGWSGLGRGSPMYAQLWQPYTEMYMTSVQSSPVATRKSESTDTWRLRKWKGSLSCEHERAIVIRADDATNGET